ncbi:MAG: DUF1573 domain-containing protein [Anaerolineaceae bacterium]|nr:DUF1573 domain-containing protein [Anaerolineaceae bacterium]
MNFRQASPAMQPSERSAVRAPAARLKLTLALLVGVILLASALYFILTWNSKRAAFHYSPADVVYGERLHASHQMEAGTPLTALDMSEHSPHIVVPSGYFDFGTVAAGRVVQKILPVANRGETPLMITSAHTTCGCTTADFTATRIPPGKVVLVTISFDTGLHDLRGQTVRRGIVIETNDPQNPSVNIWFQATVR